MKNIEEYYNKVAECDAMKCTVETIAKERGEQCIEYTNALQKYIILRNSLYGSNKEIPKSYYTPINKHYNPHTKYGRRKAREQAKYNYDHGTPEYRKDIDKMTNIFWTFAIVIIVTIFLLISFIAGPEAAVKWLK